MHAADSWQLTCSIWSIFRVIFNAPLLFLRKTMFKANRKIASFVSHKKFLPVEMNSIVRQMPVFFLFFDFTCVLPDKMICYKNTVLFFFLFFLKQQQKMFSFITMLTAQTRSRCKDMKYGAPAFCSTMEEFNCLSGTTCNRF